MHVCISACPRVHQSYLSLFRAVWLVHRGPDLFADYLSIDSHVGDSSHQAGILMHVYPF